MNRQRYKTTRREFLGRVGAAGAVATFVPRHVLGAEGQAGANDRLNIAAIGVGGQGWGDLQGLGGENIVALCDVDERQTGRAVERWPQARRFRDFRKLFDEMESGIDAVLVATPDHTHAAACLAAIERGKHLYCEKPLAHSVHEVRQVVEAARAKKVTTQLGNQGHSFDSIRTFCEWIWDGAIGNVTEVHACCDAFPQVYTQIDKLPKLSEKHEVPAELDWDLWLGPAAWREYHPMYVPFNWRGWLPFGTGAFGDWVCHVVDPVFWALDLGAPTSIQAEVDGYDPQKHADVYPAGVAITFEFPAKGNRGPVKLVWFDGSKRPPRPEDLEEGRNPPGTGAIVLGDKGTITYGSHGAGGVRIVPEAKMQAYKQPEQKLPRVPGHQQDWLAAIREGRPAGSNFDYGGALTELALLGVIAIKFPGEKLQWDVAGMRFTNSEQANQYLRPKFREGWGL